MSGHVRLIEYLKQRGADFETIHHDLDFTAQQAAHDTHTPGREFAKTVVLDIDGSYAIAVLPAHMRVDFSKAREKLHAPVTLASEAALADLFPDCEIGAEPPFGNLYGLPVYVAPELTQDNVITFNAGTHHDAIRMSYQQFDQMVQPVILDLAWHAEM